MDRGQLFLTASVLLLAGFLTSCRTKDEAAAGRVLRAGAYAMDVSPTNFPVTVNGGFFAVTAN